MKFYVQPWQRHMDGDHWQFTHILAPIKAIQIHERVDYRHGASDADRDLFVAKVCETFEGKLRMLHHELDEAFKDEQGGRNSLLARIADLEEQLESVCWHKHCEMVSGRKRDYLYCNDCKTNLESED